MYLGDVNNPGATKRVPKRVTETVAICKVTVSWPTYWLSDITRYDKMLFFQRGVVAKRRRSVRCNSCISVLQVAVS